jgi:hypothetical protein
VGETRAIAEAKREVLRDLTHAEPGLSTLAYHLDIDLGQYPLDAPLPDLNVPGVKGHYDEVREATDREQLTLRELGLRYGNRYEGGMVGSGKDVADQMQHWFEEQACDGFMVQAPTSLPGLRIRALCGARASTTQAAAHRIPRRNLRETWAWNARRSRLERACRNTFHYSGISRHSIDRQGWPEPRHQHVARQRRSANRPRRDRQHRGPGDSHRRPLPRRRHNVLPTDTRSAAAAPAWRLPPASFCCRHWRPAASG